MTKRADKWLMVKSDVTPIFCHAFKLCDEIVCVDPVMWCMPTVVDESSRTVLREQLNFKSAVIRSKRSSCLRKGNKPRLTAPLAEYLIIIYRSGGS